MRKTLITGAVVVAAIAGGAGVAIAGGDDGEGQATGAGADQAKAAALKLVPGTANAVERDTEKGATRQVDVSKPDG